MSVLTMSLFAFEQSIGPGLLVHPQSVLQVLEREAAQSKEAQANPRSYVYGINARGQWGLDQVSSPHQCYPVQPTAHAQMHDSSWC